MSNVDWSLGSPDPEFAMMLLRWSDLCNTYEEIVRCQSVADNATREPRRISNEFNGVLYKQNLNRVVALRDNKRVN